MSWLFGGSKSKDAEVPMRQDRQKCWESRDAYFACLNKAGVVKPGDEGKACAPELKEYEGNCARSWIDYFNKRRVIEDAQKDRLAQARLQSQSTK